jgi:RNA polymerase sigma factor (sigma-70 family)
MTPKQYLKQAKHLDAQINSLLREVDYWRDLSTRLSSGGFDPHYNPNRPTEAPFVHALEMIEETQRKIDQKLQKLVKLKYEISKAIEQLPDQEERMVLRYRYLNDCSWEDISALLNVSERTVYRIHGSALQHFSLPE